MAELIEKDNTKESITEDVLTSLNSYIHIADSYVQDNVTCKEIYHLGLIIDKMTEEMEKIRPYYSIIK